MRKREFCDPNIEKKKEVENFSVPLKPVFIAFHFGGGVGWGGWASFLGVLGESVSAKCSSLSNAFMVLQKQGPWGRCSIKNLIHPLGWTHSTPLQKSLHWLQSFLTVCYWVPLPPTAKLRVLAFETSFTLGPESFLKPPWTQAYPSHLFSLRPQQ